MSWPSEKARQGSYDRCDSHGRQDSGRRMGESHKERATQAHCRNGHLVYWRFLHRLHGEEMLQIKLAGTAYSLVHLNDAKNPHFIFVI